MLNEERVKLMTRMAAYEQKQGQEDFKISAYFRKDYAGWNVIWTFIWVTIGYIILLALLGVVFAEKIMEYLSLQGMIVIAGGIIIGYLLLIVCYGIISSQLYKRRHDQARERVKRYNRDLNLLNKMYKKEKR